MRDPTGVAPTDEEGRLAAVRRYDILDTPPDGAFDRVTALAARFCRVPISTITIVDHDRIWFKSAHGIEIDEIGRDPGLCASAIIRDEPYVVTDAAVDPRSLDNPLVRGELGLRFYVGVPLTTAEGYRLGTLNVIDVAPREVSTEEIATLRDLAAIVVDELELRLAARRTIELESAREATRLRDAIVAGISHEMRTPLAVLLGVAALDKDEWDDVEVHALLRRQVRHLEWLVKQFLDYATLEGDRAPNLNLTPVKLDEIIDAAVDVFGQRAPITVAIDPDVPPVVADRDRTMQIVCELVSNAVRFGGGSPVELSVTAADDGTVRVSVDDRGEGVDPDDLERLFDKFYRGRQSTGSGVGLFVSQALAEALGGRIEVDSTPGVGSRFTLVLPAAPDDPR